MTDGSGLVLVIVIAVLLFKGTPDLADGLRCRVLNIPMTECMSP
jgi:hypothetical protein